MQEEQGEKSEANHEHLVALFEILEWVVAEIKMTIEQRERKEGDSANLYNLSEPGRQN
ncbi:hypothetical protein M0R72_08135 [Candidatus Pacearchaeota archaeon]|jgi:hypothetical protein|nr:hypothetical protein [Candidatus Pacearchaeota archaeon]